MIKNLSAREFQSIVKEGAGSRRNIYNFIKNGKFILARSLGDSLLFIGESDRVWCWISSNKCEDVVELLKTVPGVVNFGWIEGFVEEQILKSRSFDWILKVNQYSLPENIRVQPPDIDTQSLVKDDAGFILKNILYKEFTDKSYIENRIIDGFSSCIKVDGELAAWVLTHDDGAMGFLHVMPRFRGRKFARTVSSDLINKLRNDGKPVFVQVEESNKPSISLARSMGFEYHCSISWFQLSR